MSLYPFGQQDDEQPTSLVESRIEGAFAGWTGRTEFKLLNGQIWRQASGGCRYHYAVMPRVAIFRAGDGLRMMVEGAPGTVRVMRLK